MGTTEIVAIRNGWIPDADFTSACAALPLVSIDLVVVNPQHQVLLGQRRNRPAQGWWFTPGARIRKNEPWKDALARTATSELGLADNAITEARFMGIWDHFYEDSAFDPKVSTHYVNFPHLLRVDSTFVLAQLPTDQHSGWRWQGLKEAASCTDIHPYAAMYLEWVLANLPDTIN